MIEPNINDGSKVIDALFEKLAAEAGVSTMDEAEDAGKSIPPQNDIYPLAPIMSERGDNYRPMRRSTSIF